LSAFFYRRGRLSGCGFLITWQKLERDYCLRKDSTLFFQADDPGYQQRYEFFSLASANCIGLALPKPQIKRGHQKQIQNR
jgi:hypothetical protein